MSVGHHCYLLVVMVSQSPTMTVLLECVFINWFLYISSVAEEDRDMYPVHTLN